jgi:hypothetical protein
MPIRSGRHGHDTAGTISRNGKNHERPDRLLYKFGCTPELRKLLFKHLNLAEGETIVSHFDIFSAWGTGLRRPDDYPTPDFSHYFTDEEQPKGSTIDGNGCLHVPAGEFHFTHYVSPLRNAQSFDDIKSYPWPDYSRFETDHVAYYALFKGILRKRREKMTTENTDDPVIRRGRRGLWREITNHR